MLECVFTLDYEINGNGTGSLRDLVLAPSAALKRLFDKHRARFVVFVEVAELELIESHGTDPAIEEARNQIQQFHAEGFDIGLHIHPWWYNAHRQNGQWVLDYSDYNLCALSCERITQIVDRSLTHLRRLLNTSDFIPLSFRAGHLLFQPAQTLARVLADRGIKIDSSVYKGGIWRQYNLDYRPAVRNGYFWRFSSCATVPDPHGGLLEIPIHTEMVPTWTMFTSKRLGLERKGSSSTQTGKKVFRRLADFARFRRPLKLDFCHMTIGELTRMVDKAVREDERDPLTFRPIVAIGHSKELVDLDAVDAFLSYLRRKQIPVSTFRDVHSRCGC